MLGEGGSALFGFVDQAHGLIIGLGNRGRSGGLGLGELPLDALQLFLALGDTGFAFFEHRLDRAKGEDSKNNDHQNKIHQLRDEKGQVESKGLLNRFKSSGLGFC